jgi:hypothetical protein
MAGIISTRADTFVRRVVGKEGISPRGTVPPTVEPQRKKVSLMQDLAAARRQILKRREGL